MNSIENRPSTETVPQDTAEVTLVAEATATSIQSKEDVIARLSEINLQETATDKTELDNIKQTFYRLRNAEVETARKAFEENGGNPDEFITPKDEFEIRFKEIMSSIKEKRNALKAEEEQEKQENLEKKLAIIEQMKDSEGVTERMKQHDQMAWVGAMNSIRNRAEEIILREMIYEEDAV